MTEDEKTERRKDIEQIFADPDAYYQEQEERYRLADNEAAE